MKKYTALLASIVALLVLVPTIFAASTRTNTHYTSEGRGGVNVIPYIRPDKKALFIDFENFTNDIDHIYYNLTYKQKWSNTLGGVEGSFFPKNTAWTGSYQGRSYIRKEILFGTCSNKSCVLHNVKDVVLTVKTYLKSGKTAQYTRVVKFPNDLF